MLYPTEQLSPDVVKRPEFRAMTACLVETLSEVIDETLVEYAEHFVPDNANDAIWTEFRNLQLIALTSFLMQKPVSQDEVIDSRFLTYEAARDYSPADESSDTDEKRKILHDTISELAEKEFKRLREEIHQLRLEKREAEERAIQALRRKQSKRNRTQFSTLDDYIQSAVDRAIDDKIKLEDDYIQQKLDKVIEKKINLEWQS